MLYEPSYMQPNLTNFDIEAEDSFFSCIVNAEGDTRVVSYELDIYTLDNELVQTTNQVTLSPILYDGDRLEVENFSSAAINGEEYVWKIRLFEEEPTILIAKGKALADCTTSMINIQNHYGLNKKMFLEFGDEIRKIDSYLLIEGENSHIQATVNSAFSGQPVENTPYSIYSDYIESSEIFFKARQKAIVEISSFPSVIDTKNYLFTGNYAQNEGVGRKYFLWNLYDVSGNLVSTSGEQNSGAIRYNFDGLIDDNSYQVELIVENQDGVLLRTPKKAFRVDYTMPETSEVVLEILEDKTAISVEWTSSLVDVEKWYIYRKENSLLYKYVATTESLTTKVIDYNVGNNTTYSYVVFPKVDGLIGDPLTSDEIKTCWWNWALLGVLKVEDFVCYIDVENIWLFDLNLTSETLTQNIQKQVINNLTRFEKISVGEQDYLSGGIKALLGQFKNEEFNDTSELEEKLKDFVSSDCVKILKDRKGNIFLVEIVSSSIEIDDKLIEQIASVSLQFVEVGDISCFSVIEEDSQ